MMSAASGAWRHALARTAALVLLLLGVPAGRAEEPLRDPAYQAVIDEAVAQGVPGLQAYVRKGSAVWYGAAGLASVEDRQPMTLERRLRLASVTKMMTYAAISEVIKEGRLKLTDRAVTVLPPGTLDGIPYADEITVEHLLDHKSGLHNFNGEDGGDFLSDLFSDPKRGARAWTANELLSYARKAAHKPTGRPGAATSYSSTGYIVLEMILQHLTKAPLSESYRRYVFAPLQMTSAGVESQGLRASEIGDSYARPDGETGPSPFAGRQAVRADGLVDLSRGLGHYNAWARGAGAVACNVRDLAKFMTAVESGTLIVLREQAAEFAKVRAAGKGSFNWNGGSWGIQASIFFAPAADVTVIVISNGSNAGPASIDLGRRLLNIARAPQ